ncbi:MAG: DUF4278 domain-containing protein [Cyanobacteria bacterium J06626_18]
MKFTYRGVSFESDFPGAASVVTGETGTFLGNCYPLKQAYGAPRQLTVELIYRGVRYSR